MLCDLLLTFAVLIFTFTWPNSKQLLPYNSELRVRALSSSLLRCICAEALAGYSQTPVTVAPHARRNAGGLIVKHRHCCAATAQDRRNQCADRSPLITAAEGVVVWPVWGPGHETPGVGLSVRISLFFLPEAGCGCLQLQTRVSVQSGRADDGGGGKETGRLRRCGQPRPGTEERAPLPACSSISDSSMSVILDVGFNLTLAELADVESIIKYCSFSLLNNNCYLIFSSVKDRSPQFGRN